MPGAALQECNEVGRISVDNNGGFGLECVFLFEVLGLLVGIGIREH